MGIVLFRGTKSTQASTPGFAEAVWHFVMPLDSLGRSKILENRLMLAIVAQPKKTRKMELEKQEANEEEKEKIFIHKHKL